MSIMKTKTVGKIKDNSGTIHIVTLRVLGTDFVRIAQSGEKYDDEPEMVDLRKENLKKLITLLKKIK